MSDGVLTDCKLLLPHHTGIVFAKRDETIALVLNVELGAVWRLAGRVTAGLASEPSCSRSPWC